jgi:heme exporter protein B
MTALFKRELTLALRSGGGAGLGLAFFLIVTVLVPFGIGPEGSILAKIAPGTLWVGALLSCLLTLDRLFQPDFEDGTLDQLALSPLPLEAIAAIKAMAHWTATGAPLVFLAIPLAETLQMPLAGLPALFYGLLLGTPALSFIGATGAALTIGVRRGGLLLSLLVLPLYIPTLIFGARAATLAANGQDPTTALLLLAGTSLFIVATAPFAAAAAIRIHLN